jgi:anti-anti-sigma regulatory factor
MRGTAVSVTTEATGLHVLFEDGQLRVTRLRAPHGVLLAGEVDITNSRTLGDLLVRIADEHGRLYVDAAGLGFIDLSGVRALLRGASGLSGEFELVNAPVCLNRLLDLLPWPDD